MDHSFNLGMLVRPSPMSSSTHSFFDQPVLYSPYEYPARHWELDGERQPTDVVKELRRKAEFITPIPKPRKRSQKALVLEDELGLSSEDQQYDVTGNINSIRRLVDEWRRIPDPSKWGVTAETARLLQHWRHHEFSSIRPFFCQVEAVETAIWLTEVAPNSSEGRKFIDYIERANLDSESPAPHDEGRKPDLSRVALKLATGAGKTTVMAMLIAWQTVNAVKHPTSSRFTKGFLIIAPGITIKDRLRVLLPNDPESYYLSRELIPSDMVEDLKKAKIVITNYHAFKLRERTEIAKGGRQLLQGRGDPIETLESEGQMIQRVLPELMGMKGIMVINDEAHHCYREKPVQDSEDDFSDLKGEDRKDAKDEAKKNAEAARLWISGIEAVNLKLGVKRVMDLSATPFFLRGSGYQEGTLFPWTVSDFSLMDAIECGIVKLPRVPVADNIPDAEVPKFRELWKHIGKKMPKKGRGKAQDLDPLSIPVELQTALDALYGHYQKVYEAWQQAGIKVPPCFIVVCNNTSTSKLIYDYISGFYQESEDGSSRLRNGRLELFQNFDYYGNPHSRPRTILVDSNQLESGEALDKDFREMAAPEIEQFKQDIIARTGDQRAADKVTDQDLLREVMNTVGKPGKLGESVRCVVSVSMLTEGWDANTVTHILGVRAFGTQLLCEQVVGRALRRNSYDLNEQGLFDVEYADILGIPFDFTAKPQVVLPKAPRETVHVRAIRPERDHCEITFPRVQGYRVELPQDKITAEFNDDSVLILNPDLVGPSKVLNQGIVGKSIDLTLESLKETRLNTVCFRIVNDLIDRKLRDGGVSLGGHHRPMLQRIVKQWLNECLRCEGGTYPAQLLYQELMDIACERILAGITRSHMGERPIKAVLDPYNPTGSTQHVNFNTSRQERWETSPEKCHLNWAILDSGWEGEFCRIAEGHPQVVSYVKNHNLGLQVPYVMGSQARKYIPDYIVRVNDGRGDDDLLNLIVEIKGYRGEDAKEKKSTMDVYWVPGVNHIGTHGRWAFAEFTDVWTMQEDFAQIVEREFNLLIEELAAGDAS